jgi:uncharacterized membrane protein
LPLFDAQILLFTLDRLQALCLILPTLNRRISAELASAHTGMKKWPWRSPSLPARLLWLAILLYAVGFSYLTLVRYFAFEARALDMGNLDQAVWNTAHGRLFHLTNQPGTVNRLSLHVEPILIPISWLYWIYSGPPTLLVLQATTVALGAWPLFLLARHRLQRDWLALLFGLAWLLNPTLQAANWLEFHPLTLAPTFLVAAFYCLVTGRTRGFALFAVLAATCKEEMALLIFMLGLYAFLILRRRRLGLITMLVSLAWPLLAVLVIQNLFADGNIHWERYGYLGDDPVSIVTTLLTRPDLVWAQLVRANALRYFFLLLLPVGFTALAAPELLLLALPSLGLNLLADFPPMHEVTTLIYAVPIAPFVLMAAVFGVERIGKHVMRNAYSALSTHYALRITPSPPLLLTGLVLIGALYAQLQHGYLPGGGNFRQYTITDHHRRAAGIIAQIPAGAKVSAQDRLNPHVSGRETVYIFPRIDDADTVFVDVTGPAWPLHPSDVRRTVDELLAGEFGIAAADDGYLLLRKGTTGRELPASFYTAWQAEPVAGPRAEVRFGDQLRLLDYRVITDSHGELVTQLVWEALKPINQELRFYVGYLDEAGAVLHETPFYPPVAELWYPTTRWTPGQPVLVQTLPWTLATDRFTLVLAVYSGDDGRQADQRLPVSAEDGITVLEAGTLTRLAGYSRNADNRWIEQAPPAPPTGPSTAEFGGQLVLAGWQGPSQPVAAGDVVQVTLHWQTRQPPALDASLFLHLLDETGNKVAQFDGQPHDFLGPRPMTGWQVGETLVGVERLPIPPETPPGRYRLVMGLYNWQTGERLPVTGPAAQPDQTVQLLEIEIE